jgi:hypothetical protein
MNPFHELRRALITAWLLTFDDYHPDAPDLRQTVRRDIERLVLMWLRTPHSTVMMWIESDWAEEEKA